MYLRDSKNNPIGCIAVEPNATGVKIAMSRCHSSDKFIKKVARDKAIGRLDGTNNPDDNIYNNVFLTYAEVRQYGLNEAISYIFGYRAVQKLDPINETKFISFVEFFRERQDQD